MGCTSAGEITPQGYGRNCVTAVGFDHRYFSIALELIDEMEHFSLIDAEAAVGFSVLKERFSTWVRHDRNRDLVEVGLIRGPFRHLKNRWEFFPDPAGTRVEFMIDFAFKSRMLDLMLSANFDRAVEKLIGCFEAEAVRRYGRR